MRTLKNYSTLHLVGILCLAICGALLLNYFQPEPQTIHPHSQHKLPATQTALLKQASPQVTPKVSFTRANIAQPLAASYLILPTIGLLLILIVYFKVFKPSSEPSTIYELIKSSNSHECSFMGKEKAPSRPSNAETPIYELILSFKKKPNLIVNVDNPPQPQHTHNMNAISKRSLVMSSYNMRSAKPLSVTEVNHNRSEPQQYSLEDRNRLNTYHRQQSKSTDMPMIISSRDINKTKNIWGYNSYIDETEEKECIIDETIFEESDENDDLFKDNEHLNKKFLTTTGAIAFDNLNEIDTQSLSRSIYNMPSAKMVPVTAADSHSLDILGVYRNGQSKGTDIQIAVYSGDIDKVKSLLGSNSDSAHQEEIAHDINAVDANGQTAVHIAVSLRLSDILAELLLQKPLLDIQDNTKESFAPLHWAAFYGYPEIAAQLIIAGANVNSKVKNVNSAYGGKRPIDIAVQKGFLQVVITLITANADLKAVDTNSPSPLAVASKKKYAYIERSLKFGLKQDQQAYADKEHYLPPTPCIYDPSYKMVTPKQRQQLFKDLGLKYMKQNEFTPGCVALSQLQLSPSQYNSYLTEKYGPYIKAHYVAPCSLKWVDDRVGYGFFSESTLKPKDYIIEFTGTVIESSKLQKKSWSWGYRYGNGIDNFYESTCLDSTDGGNEARFINHSDHADNVTIAKVFFENSWHQLYIATTEINKGDQFLINYGSGYWTRKQHIKVDLFR